MKNRVPKKESFACLKNWAPTEENLKNAQILFEEELIHPLTLENMYNGGLYCVLTSAESYTKLKVLTKELLEYGLTTPENILRRRKRLNKILGKTRFPGTKISRVVNFSLWWPTATLPGQIIEDVNIGRKNGFALRNSLAEEAPGLGYKCASLL